MEIKKEEIKVMTEIELIMKIFDFTEEEAREYKKVLPYEISDDAILAIMIEHGW